VQIIASIAASTPFQRFDAAIGALVPEWVADDNTPPLLLAVSGGPDSLAMLAMASACFSGRVAALTVDHGLRMEAADEARFVSQRAAELGVAHTIARPPYPITGNVQSAARAARYTLLLAEAERLGGAFIVTAHHADDQLETILMRLSRGSGVAGLSGVRPINGRIIRPLLGFRKEELRAVCATMAWQPVEDPSNADDHFDRVAMRQALAKAHLPITPTALDRTAKAMRDADEALNWATATLSDERLQSEPKGGLILDVTALPHELVRRLMTQAMTVLNEVQPRGEQIETAIAKLRGGEAASLGDIIIRIVDFAAPKWHLSPAPPRNTPRKVQD
jgi:tRNA(Ile)-lysidine synthase